MKQLKTQWIFHLFIWPPLIMLIIFHFIPLFQGIRMSFQDFKPAKGFFGEQQWIGLDNYRYLFELPTFSQALVNTIIISIIKIFLMIVVPVLVAVLLDEVSSRKLRKLIQTSITLPHFISWVLLAGIYINILSPSEGGVNVILNKLGLESIYFLGDGRYFKATIIITDVLKEFGFATIVYLAAIANIDQEQYEAAEVDGAKRYQRIWYITLPNMQMIIVLMTVLSLGQILNAGFDQVYNMLNSAVTKEGEILDTLIYKMGFTQFEYSLSTAANMFKSIVSLILIGTAYLYAYKRHNYVVF